jgi:SAM-dependent methyltransferase
MRRPGKQVAKTERQSMNKDAATVYNPGYFAYLKDSSLDSAKIVAPLIMNIVQPSSVVDVGCGTGAWLSAFAELGIDDYLGMDGAWVRASDLLIPETHFARTDLTAGNRVERRFDLALSLEVAEHLDESTAADFVDLLVSLSDRVVFSAASPYQGGAHHVNERWPDYWHGLFRRHGYECYDILRPMLWQLPVAFYYAQNMLLFARTDDEKLRAKSAALLRWNGDGRPPYPLIHPMKLFEQTSVRPLLTALPGALRRALRRRLGRNSRSASDGPA